MKKKSIENYVEHCVRVYSRSEMSQTNPAYL